METNYFNSTNEGEDDTPPPPEDEENPLSIPPEEDEDEETLGKKYPSSRKHRTNEEKLEIIRYADIHGPTAAIRKYKLTSKASVWNWRQYFKKNPHKMLNAYVEPKKEARPPQIIAVKNPIHFQAEKAVVRNQTPLTVFIGSPEQIAEVLRKMRD